MSCAANILFTKTLAKKLSNFDVTVNCLHPGFVSTGIRSNNNKTLWTFLMFLAKPFARNTDKGAETSIYLCCSPEVKDVSGEYFVDYLNLIGKKISNFVLKIFLEECPHFFRRIDIIISRPKVEP